MFLVVRPPDTLFLPPSIVPKWRGLRGLDALLLAERGRRLRVALRGDVRLQPRDLLPQHSVLRLDLRKHEERMTGRFLLF